MRTEFCCPICSGEHEERILLKDSKEGEYSLVRCGDCDQIAISPIPEKDKLKEYYNTVFEVPLYQEKKTRRKSITVLNELKRLGISKNAKILEIGASYGFFMKIANDVGFETYGLEMSERACEYAKNEFGIEIENSSLGESQFVQNSHSFDAVILLDVIEHVTDPSEMISQIESVLNPGGFVVITTPNIESLEFKFFGKYWEWISPPAHLFYFSKRTLANLLRHKMEISYVKTFKGDSGGNIVFHGIYSLLKIIYWSPIGKLFGGFSGKGEAVIIEEDRRSIKKNEFTGVLRMAHLFSLSFTPITTLFDAWRNSRDKGASLLMIGKKMS
jgi:2-polyprenyl-3-methyl-5-hydroxy-6-metoxy-1,4-benzoquinol methylase